MISIVTPWGENPDSRNVRLEYSRSQMRRKNYAMLNGIWEYRILTGKEGENAEAGKEFAPDGQKYIGVELFYDCILKKSVSGAARLRTVRAVCRNHFSVPEVCVVTHFRDQSLNCHLNDITLRRDGREHF